MFTEEEFVQSIHLKVSVLPDSELSMVFPPRFGPSTLI